MKFIISYKQFSKNGKWYYRTNEIVSEEKLDSILSDPNCVLINGQEFNPTIIDRYGL